MAVVCLERFVNALIVILSIILIPQKFGLRQDMEGCFASWKFSIWRKTHGWMVSTFRDDDIFFDIGACWYLFTCLQQNVVMYMHLSRFIRI